MRGLAFTYAGNSYRADPLNAFDQFACLDMVAPLLTKAKAPQRRFRSAPPDRLQGLIEAVGLIDERQAADLFALTLRDVEWRGADGWQPIWDADAEDIRDADLTAAQAIGLVGRVVFENLKTFLVREPFKVETRGEPPPSFTAVELPDGKSWLLRPVERGMCRYESLKDGTLDLADIALMNEQLSATAENESRAHKASKDN